MQPDPTPTQPTSLGMFSSMPVGLVFADTATGTIDLSASAVGDYMVTYITKDTPTTGWIGLINDFQPAICAAKCKWSYMHS